MFDNVNQNNVKLNGIDCFYSVEKNMCTRFMVIKSGSQILFHHSNGKSEPVLGTNTCGIFFREQKSLKVHCKKIMMWLQNGSNLYSIFFFQPAIIACFQILAISIFSSLIGDWSELILLAFRNKDKTMATSIHLLLFK